MLRLYRLFCLYGERPFRAIIWALVIVALFGLVFLRIGIAPKGIDPKAIPTNITAEIIEGPDNKSVIILNPVEEELPSHLPLGTILYDGFDLEDLSRDEFPGDYYAGVSVVFSLFVNRAVLHTYVVVNPVLGPLALSCEIILLVMFLGLFLFSFIRKYRMSGS